MKNSYSFDKTGIAIGICVIAVGSFIDPLVMILGSIMVAFSIMANLVESYKARKYKAEEAPREDLFGEIVSHASEVPTR